MRKPTSVCLILAVYTICPVHAARVFEDENQEYFMSSSAPTFDRSVCSYSIWFKADEQDTDAAYNLISIGRSTSDGSQYQRVYTYNGYVRALHYNDGSKIAASTTTFSTGEWHNCIGVFDTSTTYVWLDNAGGGTFSYAILDFISDRIGIGVWAKKTPAVTSTFSGSLAHVAIWDIAIDSAARSDLQTKTPDQVESSHLIGYWPLDESGGGNAIDNEDTGTDYDLTEYGTISYSSDSPFAPDPLDQATTPDPIDDANDVALTQILSWSAVTDANNYEVYFGPDANDINDLYVATVTDPNYDPDLSYDTVYQWRVDPNSDDAGTTTGVVWSFTTVSAPAEPNAPSGWQSSPTWNQDGSAWHEGSPIWNRRE